MCSLTRELQNPQNTQPAYLLQRMGTITTETKLDPKFGHSAGGPTLNAAGCSPEWCQHI